MDTSGTPCKPHEDMQDCKVLAEAKGRAMTLETSEEERATFLLEGVEHYAGKVDIHVNALCRDIDTLIQERDAARAALLAEQRAWEHMQGCQTGCEWHPDDSGPTWCGEAHRLFAEADKLRGNILQAKEALGLST